MYGYIYKISNTVNSKVYIGQTTKSVSERFEAHLSSSKQKSKASLHLYLAMNKYGQDKFFVEQIDTATSRVELNEKERYWIDFYDSINNGYNMLPGGSDTNPMSESDIKQKHDQKMQSAEVRTKISETLSQYRNTVGFSAEHKAKIKQAREQRKLERAALGLSFYDHPEHMASRSLPVYCVLSNGDVIRFKSILDAGKWWYETYKPFGEVYSTATYQRKIQASINGETIKYRKFENGKSIFIVISNIHWYYDV